MVIEQHPSLHSLSVEDKLQLSEELCLDAQRNPALLERVQQRLQEYREEPDGGIFWDDLKGKILSRRKVA